MEMLAPPVVDGRRPIRRTGEPRRRVRIRQARALLTALAAVMIGLVALTGCTGTTTTTTAGSTGGTSTTVSSAATSTPTSTRSATTFSPVQSEPVIVAPPGGTAVTPRVVLAGGNVSLFYTFAQNGDDANQAIHYTASQDGRSFPAGALTLAGDPKTFEEGRVAEPVPIVADGKWYLYYNAGKYAPGAFNLGPSVGRAVASAPTGPWQHDPQPVLRVGPPDAWDSGFVAPNAVFKSYSGWVMFYSGGKAAGGSSLLGMARSQDGVSWTKYNDPNTQSSLYAESDPVLGLGPAGSWDDKAAFEAAVLETAAGYEMFYTGISAVKDSKRAVGFATSADGIHWARSAANPVFVSDGLTWAPAGVMAGSVIPSSGGEYALYFSGMHAPTLGSIGLEQLRKTGGQ